MVSPPLPSIDTLYMVFVPFLVVLERLVAIPPDRSATTVPDDYSSANTTPCQNVEGLISGLEPDNVLAKSAHLTGRRPLLHQSESEPQLTIEQTRRHLSY